MITDNMSLLASTLSIPMERFCLGIWLRRMPIQILTKKHKIHSIGIQKGQKKGCWRASRGSKCTTQHIGAVQLAKWSILVSEVIIWNISYELTLLGISCGLLPKKFPNHGPFMVQTWPSYGPFNWFFLSLNQYPKGCFMPNLRILAAISTDTFNFLTQ